MSNSFVTLWTAACQAPMSVGFHRKEYWSRLSFPSPILYLHHCKCMSDPVTLYPRQALIYSFLMANAIETLIMYLFAIYMKCLFLSLTQFPTGFFFPLLSFRSSLYLLDTNPLSKMLSANISPSL